MYVMYVNVQICVSTVCMYLLLPPSVAVSPPPSCAGQSDSPELSSSNTDDDSLPRQPAMTRLDRPAHRPDPREWMGEARARDAFSKSPGTSSLPSPQVPPGPPRSPQVPQGSSLPVRGKLKLVHSSVVLVHSIVDCLGFIYV